MNYGNINDLYKPEHVDFSNLTIKEFATTSDEIVQSKGRFKAIIEGDDAGIVGQKTGALETVKGSKQLGFKESVKRLAYQFARGISNLVSKSSGPRSQLLTAKQKSEYKELDIALKSYYSRAQQIIKGYANGTLSAEDKKELSKLNPLAQKNLMARITKNVLSIEKRIEKIKVYSFTISKPDREAFKLFDSRIKKQEKMAEKFNSGSMLSEVDKRSDDARAKTETEGLNPRTEFANKLNAAREKNSALNDNFAKTVIWEGGLNRQKLANPEHRRKIFRLFKQESALLVTAKDLKLKGLTSNRAETAYRALLDKPQERSEIVQEQASRVRLLALDFVMAYPTDAEGLKKLKDLQGKSPALQQYMGKIPTGLSDTLAIGQIKRIFAGLPTAAEPEKRQAALAELLKNPEVVQLLDGIFGVPKSDDEGRAGSGKILDPREKVNQQAIRASIKPHIQRETPLTDAQINKAEARKLSEEFRGVQQKVGRQMSAHVSREELRTNKQGVEDETVPRTSTRAPRQKRDPGISKGIVKPRKVEVETYNPYEALEVEEGMDSDSDLGTEK